MHITLTFFEHVLVQPELGFLTVLFGLPFHRKQIELERVTGWET